MSSGAISQLLGDRGRLAIFYVMSIADPPIASEFRVLRGI
jgi:hypothetical protein